MQGRKIKVLYIAGMGRSGSTLLARLLGELDGVLNVGEAARYLFNTTMMSRDLPCGCGSKVSECAFWKDIVPKIDTDMQRFCTDFVRIRRFPLLISPVKSPAVREKEKKLLSAIEALYVAVTEHSGCEVIIDSSKNPSNAYILSKVPNVELSVVHLVRDPRGVVSSSSRPKGYLQRRPPLKVALWWLAYNLPAELLRTCAERYWLVRYEDFVQYPKDIVGEIASQVRGKVVEANFLNGTQAQINLQHVLAGNPAKSTQGPLKIEAQKWELPRFMRLLVTLLTLPLLYRYRYSFAQPRL